MTIKMIITFVMIILFASYNTEATIGMNWGRQTVQRLLPSQVVDLMLQNGVKRARVYTSQPDILDAFSGSGIDLTIGLFDPTKFKTPDEAKAWVHNIHNYIIPSNIRQVYIGGSAFEKAITDKTYMPKAWNTLNWMREALQESKFGKQVKPTFLITGQILKNDTIKPSESEFLDEIKQDMVAYLQFIKQHDIPFAVEFFPIATCIIHNFDLSFAFADNKSTLVITDVNGAVYNNFFEWQYDCFVWAISKLILESNIKISVSQVGWPTDGIAGATAANAERFYKHLLLLVTSNKGTPMQPGVPIDVFLHSLTDENRMMTSKPFTRHWGIYRSNGQPKFKIDLTGQGRDIYPTVMKGIMPMPQRWCQFNGDMKNASKVRAQMNWACTKSDCTSAAPGGSCSALTFSQNVSYAFNMYFQSMFQDEAACNFDGLGFVSIEDPSTEMCLFPVEVVKGLQLNFEPVTPGEGFHARPSLAVWLCLAFMLFWI